MIKFCKKKVVAAGGFEPGTLGDDLFTNSSAAAEVSENDFDILRSQFLAECFGRKL